MNRKLRSSIILIQAMALLTLLSVRLKADTGTCGGATTTVPFTDVGSSIFFCQIAEAYFSGLTNGTSPTTYSPSDPVPREQMAAFITRTQDSALRRGSKRAALQQFWTTTPSYPAALGGLGTTTVGSGPSLVQSDGSDLWVANILDGTVSRVHASDGKLLEAWGVASPTGVLVAMGRVFVTGKTSTSGKLYMIDPTRAPSGLPLSPVASVAANPIGIAFDGSRIWTADQGGGAQGGSVSIVTPGMTTPWAVTIVTGFSLLAGILFDGSNIWVTDEGADTLLKLDQNGAILQTVHVGSSPKFPAFDGTNFWVPNSTADSVSVVRAATSVVIATLTGNGLNSPSQAAFDGQRVLVTNLGDSVSLWRAADLAPIGSFSTGAATLPFGACSDGINFWITLQNTNQLARF